MSLIYDAWEKSMFNEKKEIIWAFQTSQCKSEKGNFVVIKLLGKGKCVCLAFGQIVQLFLGSLGWSNVTLI